MSRQRAPIPTRLGKYEVLDRIAYGGMAEIFLARELGIEGLKRLVVIKRILPQFANDETFVKMFLQEANFVGRLTHPNVVQIHDFGAADGSYYIAMEYISGVAVRELLAQARRRELHLPIGAVLPLIVQTCEGAHAAHELRGDDGKRVGLVHRDITPHNLMVTAEGFVKLLDFGIAKATEQALDLTRTGGLKGKLHYLSPEQCKREHLDRRSDIFAIAVVAAELLTGQRLFDRGSELATMQAIVEGHYTPLREQNPEIPRSIAMVLEKALATRPGARFASADDMRKALLNAAHKEGIELRKDDLAGQVQALSGEGLKKTRKLVQMLVERANNDATRLHHDFIEDTTGSLPRWSTGSGSGSGSASASHNSFSGNELMTATAMLQRKAKRNAWLKLWGPRFAALLVLLMGLAGVYYLLTRPPPLMEPTIDVVLAPALDSKVLLRELEPLRLYVQQQLQHPVHFTVAKNYHEAGQSLAMGNVPFAILTPNLYLETHAQEPLVLPIVTGRYGGGRGNDGILLVREGSKFRKIEDLRGARICYSDPDSTTGYLLPRGALRKVGIDPDRDLGGALISGNHMQSMRDLIAGKCDVAGTFSNAYRTADEAGIAVTTLRVLGLTGRAPHDAWCSGPGTEPAEIESMRKALLSFDPQKVLGRPWLGEVQRITAYAAVSDQEYDWLRQAIADERAASTVRNEDAGSLP